METIDFKLPKTGEQEKFKRIQVMFVVNSELWRKGY